MEVGWSSQRISRGPDGLPFQLSLYPSCTHGGPSLPFARRRKSLFKNPQKPHGRRNVQLDETFEYDMGSGEQTRSTTELTKPFEYLHSMFRGRKSLCRTVILRNTLRNNTRFLDTPYQIPPATPLPFSHQLPEKKCTCCIVRAPLVQSSERGEIFRALARAKSIESGCEGVKITDQQGSRSRYHHRFRPRGGEGYGTARCYLRGQVGGGQ